jgi:hypothetical protein
MNNKPDNLILALALSYWGVGFAVMEGKDIIVDRGMRGTEGDKNATGAAEVKRLIEQYKPDAIVIEDAFAEGIRRTERIRSLAKRILVLAAKAKVKAVSLPREEIRGIFFAEGLGTRDGLAAAVAERFANDLGHLLPPKRALWAGEHYRMAIFEAVAAGFAFAKKSAKK